MDKLIQFKDKSGNLLFPKIKTANVINDGHFLQVSDSGAPGQYLVMTPFGPRWEGSKPQDVNSRYIEFSEAPSNKVQLQGLNIPVGVETSAGNYYPIQKGSLDISISDSAVTLNITPYLAYQGAASMSGIWKAWLSAGYETSDSREFHTFYKKFSQVVDSIVVFDSLNIPIGIQAASGTYYPVQKGSVDIGVNGVSMDITPYLAYEGISALSDSWTAWFSAQEGQGGDMSNYYTKSEADMLLQAKAGVNADNFTAAGKDTIIDNSFQIDPVSSESVQALNTYYSADRAGLLTAQFSNQSNVTADCYINVYVKGVSSQSLYYYSGGFLGAGLISRHCLFVPKGSQYRVVAGSSGVVVTWSAAFTPLKNSIASS